MFFYKINDQIVYSKSSLSVGEELVPNTTDGAYEKHVPVIEEDGNKVMVTVGAVEHPMLDVHFIEWILLETATGFQVKKLLPGMKPSAVFTADEKVLAAYEYCNLHGLWVKEI